MNDDFLADFNTSLNEKERVKLQKLSGGEFDKFARNVVSELINDNIPPIPMNYQIYFNKLLDGPSVTMTFRKRVEEMMDFEKTQDSKQAFIENKVKKSFTSINVLLQDIAMIYKNTEVMKELIEKRNAELTINSSALAINNIISMLQSDFERYLAVLERCSCAVKSGFEDVSYVYKSIEENSDFDQNFDVYNRKFLLHLLKTCKEGFERYNYQHCIVFFRIKDGIFKNLEAKGKFILLKTLAKILNKNAKKGNVVAHYQDGIFAMLLQHTNINKTKEFIENIIEQIYNTNFFISDTEIEMDLQVSVTAIKDDDTEKLIAKLIKALDRSGKDKENFVVLDQGF